MGCWRGRRTGAKRETKRGGKPAVRRWREGRRRGGGEGGQEGGEAAVRSGAGGSKGGEGGAGSGGDGKGCIDEVGVKKGVTGS